MTRGEGEEGSRSHVRIAGRIGWVGRLGTNAIGFLPALFLMFQLSLPSLLWVCVAVVAVSVLHSWIIVRRCPTLSSSSETK